MSSKKNAKKFIKNSLLLINIAAIPESFSMDEWFDIVKNHKIMLHNGKFSNPFEFISKTKVKNPGYRKVLVTEGIQKELMKVIKKNESI